MQIAQKEEVEKMKKSNVHILRNGNYEMVTAYGNSGKAIAKDLKAEDGVEILKMETVDISLNPDEIKTIVDFARNISEDTGLIVEQLLTK